MYLDMENACKLGMAKNIPERDSQYATGELRRGKFSEVYEVENMAYVEAILKDNFKNFNIRYDGGTEYFSKEIIDKIEPTLNMLKIKFVKLSEEEISSLVRFNRYKRDDHKYNKVSLVPRDYQNDIIDKSVSHFNSNSKGLLVLMCGVGKTLISLWIAQRLNSKRLLIGVPNILLLDQWNKMVEILFNDYSKLQVLGGVDEQEIIDFLNENEKCIVITTYSSSFKISNVTTKIGYEFDIKINDEVHHLTSQNFNDEERKSFISMLKIKSNKQLSLTATLKVLENQENKSDHDLVISNDNLEYFGDIIDKKGLLWAIDKNIICDYLIQTIITDEEILSEKFLEFNITSEIDKRLFLSAYSCLKSIMENHSHHLLIYCNNKDNSTKIIEYISQFLKEKYFLIEGLYYNDYHSGINSKEQDSILESFKRAKFGILTCVYCLGEGWDFPLLDGVVFAENMSSNIRIVQSALRASRKNSSEKNKITKIILPVLNATNWLEGDNADLRKVKEVIYQMSLEDETIEQKIKVCKISINKYEDKFIQKERDNINEFGEYDEDITNSLLLKTIKRTVFGLTYEKARKIISENQITDKDNYYKLCDNDYRLSKDPEIIFKGQFTNWIDYLSIERKFYDIDTCKSKVSEYLSEIPQIKDQLDLTVVCKKLCIIDNNFPPNGLWVEYYNVKDLGEIISVNNKKKKSSQILTI